MADETDQAQSSGAPPAPVQLITSSALAAITGLTDRRHRQLAEQGYFPPPVKMQYQMAVTIRGLFRYYREHNMRTKERIVESRDRKTVLETELIKLRLAKERHEALDRREVGQMLGKAGGLIRGRLYAALEREFPARVAGRSPDEVSLIGRALADELIGLFAGIDNGFPRVIRKGKPRKKTDAPAR